MKPNLKPEVVDAAEPMLEGLSFDCPCCGVTHHLTRGLDFEADRRGDWRCKETPGYECDCGVLIRCDFRLTRLPALDAVRPEPT